MGREEKESKAQRLEVLETIRGHDSTIAHAFMHTDDHCPACGTLGPHQSMFCDPGPIDPPLPRVRGCELDGRHLHRICKLCSYPWVERCMDQAMMSQQRFEASAESLPMAALSALTQAQDGIRVALDRVNYHKGWVVVFEQEQESGTIRITTRPPEAQQGKIRHPTENA